MLRERERIPGSASLRICDYPRCMDAEFRGGQNVAVIFRDILVLAAVDSLAGSVLNAPTKSGGVFESSIWTEKPYFLRWQSSVANKSNQNSCDGSPCGFV